MDADLLMQTIAEVLKKIEDYSISNRAEFEALVKKNRAMQQTDQTKKQQKRIPQITTRLEQIVLSPAKGTFHCGGLRSVSGIFREISRRLPQSDEAKGSPKQSD